MHVYLQTELHDILGDGSWSCMLQIQCLANATSCAIWSMYPKYDQRIRDNFNTIVQPWTLQNDVTDIFPMFWSGFAGANGWFTNNHFTALVSLVRVNTYNHCFIHPAMVDLTTNRHEVDILNNDGSQHSV